MVLLSSDEKLLKTVNIANSFSEQNVLFISLQGFDPGIYYLVAITDRKKSTAKIIKY